MNRSLEFPSPRHIFPVPAPIRRGHLFYIGPFASGWTYVFDSQSYIFINRGVCFITVPSFSVLCRSKVSFCVIQMDIRLALIP